jgi:hypothetical protein
MKVSILSTVFILAVFLISSCTNEQEKVDTEPLNIPANTPKLTLSANLGGRSPLDTTNTIYIATTLYNPSVDTIRFLSMTCSYEDFFLADSGSFKIAPFNICYSNVPAVIALPPGRKVDHYITIRPVTNQKDLRGQRIKIGMYYVSSIDWSNCFDLYQKRFHAPIIWSNELNLERLYSIIY